MAYVGRGIDKISNVEVLDNITFSGASSYTLQKGSVNYVPSSSANLLISIDGVVQANNFTINGSTIDFGVAVANTSTCNFVLHYGVGVITTPQDGSVTTVKIGDDAVTYAKLQNLATANRVLGSASTGLIGETQVATAMVSDDAITYAKMQDTSAANKVLGAVSAGTVGEVSIATDMISDAQVDEAKLKISNAPTNGYFLSAQSGNTGGMTWAEAGGGEWTKIKTITLSGSTSSVIFLNGSSGVVIDNTYSTYKVIWNGISGYDSTDSIMYAQVYDGGTDGTGTTLDTGANYTYGTRSYDNHSTILYQYALGASYMKLYTKPIDNQARRGYAGEFTAYNVNQVAADICTKFFRLAGTSNDAADGYAMHNSMIGTWENAADTVRGFKFYPSAGTFGRGEFILYGIK